MKPHRFTLAIVFLILGTFDFSQAVNACSCVGERPICEKFGYSKAVFLGKAIGGTVRESGKDENGKRKLYVTGRVTFQIEEAFSGVKNRKIVTVDSGGPCGTGFTQGESYLIFASGENADQLGTSMCSGNRSLETATENLQFLRTLPPEGSGAKLYGAITKTVREKDADGNRKAEGLSGINLTIKKSSGETFTAETDQQGKYEIPGLKPGEYKVEADLPAGYKKGEYQSERNFSVQDRGCANVNFWAQSDNRISGRVIDADGTIPQKIKLVLIETTQKEKGLSTRDEAACEYFDPKDERNKDGRFEFGHPYALEAGEYYLGVNLSENPDEKAPYAPTYYPGVTDRAQATVLKVGIGTIIDDIVFQLPPKLAMRKQTIQGVVVWPDGSPAVNATVYLQDESRPGRSISGFEKADAQGKFTLTGYAGFSYEIVGYAEKSRSSLEGKKQEIEVEPYKIKLTNNVAGIKIVLTKEKKKDE